MKRLTLRSGFKRVRAMGHGNHKQGNNNIHNLTGKLHKVTHKKLATLLGQLKR